MNMKKYAWINHIIYELIYKKKWIEIENYKQTY